MRLVAFLRAGIDGHDGVPKDSQHPHVVSVIPHRRRNPAARTGYPRDFSQGGFRIQDEVEDQQRQTGAEGPVAESELLGVADLEAHSLAGGVPALCELHMLARGVDSHNARLFLQSGDRFRQRACPRADVESLTAIGRFGELHQKGGQHPAPAAHEPFVCLRIAEHLRRRLLSACGRRG
jgi:hypothetical protein